ncbi:MAG: hypothetical protein C4344_02085, partial [Acidimicrobiia bacterium]
MLGAVHELGEIGRNVPIVPGGSDAGDYVDVLQQLGSPAAVYEHLDIAMAQTAPVLDARAEPLGPRGWLVHQRFRPGFDPFPEWFAYVAGLHSIVPRLFG